MAASFVHTTRNSDLIHAGTICSGDTDIEIGIPTYMLIVSCFFYPLDISLDIPDIRLTSSFLP
ncbi:hypothetical protein CSA56_18260 [candidate division KSB3 bacterium]|uniref:Uncharacterized protein n=1 Tax=candidate division KSB3 bacterium TaxID=2044937 RepID=A0A2G6K9L0_9BACT|nr:MAG: hypothetical protein CSA56_18260 [candidate division KSB3 bacterium]